MRANPNTTLTINGGGGNDSVELDSAAARDQITINLGNGNSTAQVEGTALDPSSQVTVNGGPGADTLLFDAQGQPITTYDASGNLRPSSQPPALPNGQIQVSGGADAGVIYTQITSIPGFVGATIGAGGPYTINEGEGQGVTFAGTATAATNSTNLSAAWDLNGSGAFSIPAVLTQTSPGTYNVTASLTWAQLVSLGLNGPGTYPIALRVYSTSNTVTAYSSLTINPVAPTLSVPPEGTAIAGVPYTLTFSGQEVAGANYSITGWTINWGDGTPSDPDITTLPSDATSATHTFTSAGKPTISVTASDNYFAATTATQSLTVSVGPQSVGAGGPYTIATGDSLTLTATAAGNLSASSFQWELGNVGLPDGTATFNSSSGYTTDQVTQTWADLQGLGIDETKANSPYNVTVSVAYPASTSSASTTVTASTTLTVNATPPTATFTGTNAPLALGGTSTVSFTSPFDPSAAETAAGFTYSYDFSDNGTFAIAGSTSPTAAVPANFLAQPGSFVVHGRITAQDGQFTDYYTTIHVADVAPSVSVGPGQTISPGSPFALSGVTFSDPGYATSSSS